ncbi:MAG: asparagine synthetase B, partial [Rhabdaerophilum calidifontis]
MNAAQAHRGPDGAGSHAVPELGFAMAMRRLAIIDIAGGRQPLVSADGRYALVFNGEIFNAPELRRELEARGIRFASDHSDTETLFRLLVADGPQAVSRLNGMFAFAFLDREAGTLALGRD